MSVLSYGNIKTNYIIIIIVQLEYRIRILMKLYNKNDYNILYTIDNYLTVQNIVTILILIEQYNTNEITCNDINRT